MRNKATVVSWRQWASVKPLCQFVFPLFITLAGIFAAERISPAAGQKPVPVVSNPRNPVARGGLGLEVKLIEDLRIGSAGGSGEADFSRLSGLLVDERGSLIALDGKEGRITVFDLNGHVLRKFGRRGQGPQDIQSATGLMLSPDSAIAVLDSGNSRLSFFSYEGVSQKSVPLRGASPLEPVMDRLGNVFGSFLSFSPTVELKLVKFDAGFIPQSTLAVIRMPKERDLPPAELMQRFYYAVYAGDSIVWADNFKYELNIVDKNANLIRRITRDAVAEPLSRRRLVRLLKTRMPDRSFPDSMPIPDHFPKTFPFLDLIVGDDQGRVYVRTFEQIDSSRRIYDVYGEDGTFVSQFLLPEDEEIKAVKKGKAYIMIRAGQDGLPMIKRYRMEWKEIRVGRSPRE